MADSYDSNYLSDWQGYEATSLKTVQELENDIQKQLASYDNSGDRLYDENGNLLIKPGSIIGYLYIKDATITSATIQYAAIQSAHIGEAVIGTAHIQDLTVTSAKIADASIGTAKIQDASIVSAKIGIAQIDAAHIKAGVIGTVQIADGSITDAKIVSLTATKLEAGTIDTGQVTIQGAGGKMRITGNRLQVFDQQSVPVERVSVGDVWGNGSVYGFLMRAADGQTVLMDINGVKSAGITDGAITNPKISDGAIENRNIYAGTITADRLVADSITARQIAAKTITANEMVVGTITAGSGIIGSLDAGTIVTGTLDASKITVLNLVVGGNVSMGPYATISWDKVTDRPSVPSSAYFNGFGEYVGPVLWDKVTGKPNLPNTTYINAFGVYTGEIVASQIASGYLSSDRISVGTLVGSNIRTTESSMSGQVELIGSVFKSTKYNTGGGEYFKIENGVIEMRTYSYGQRSYQRIKIDGNYGLQFMTEINPSAYMRMDVLETQSSLYNTEFIIRALSSYPGDDIGLTLQSQTTLNLKAPNVLVNGQSIGGAVNLSAYATIAWANETFLKPWEIWNYASQAWVNDKGYYSSGSSPTFGRITNSGGAALGAIDLTNASLTVNDGVYLGSANVTVPGRLTYGTIAQSSDMVYKDEIEEFGADNPTLATDIVMSGPIFKYRRVDLVGSPYQIGAIVQYAPPEIVDTPSRFKPEDVIGLDKADRLSLIEQSSYMVGDDLISELGTVSLYSMVSIIWRMNQEQQVQIQAQQAQINQLIELLAS